jgi:ribosomal-protein-alanine N-acetyltransferase
MLLEFSDYRIRDLTPADASSIARHADNPRIADVMRDLFPSPYALSDAEEFIAKALSADPLTAFAIATDKEAFGVIGYIAGKDVYRHSAEFGYWIGEEYWGRGIMTGVIDVFTAHLFENFDYKRLSAGVFSSNPASARVLEKAGFTLVATLRAHVTKNGEVLDEILYSRLRPGLVG